MAKEWDGTSAQADHVNDPGPNHGYNGRGNREAYYIAAGSTLNTARHAIIEGTAPAGVTLRLKKTFKTDTFPQADDKPISFDDGVDNTYDVTAAGPFTWHVNPSTRPIVAKATGKENAGQPSAPYSTSGTVL